MEALADRMRRASRITILTGAGVSAPSGVPTFRGVGGLWREFRPEDLATPAAFARDPRLVWEWYEWRRQQIARCRPNPAHDVIAAWSDGGAAVRPQGGAGLAAEVVVITQNVDDLHLRAGTRGLVRLHGSIWELACWRRCAGAGASSWTDDRVPLDVLPPACPHCGGPARPAVVWFGEPLGDAAWASARRAAACDVFLSVGTSAVVYPAAALLHEARRDGAFTAEINLDETPASSVVDLALRAPVEAALPALAALIAGTPGSWD